MREALAEMARAARDDMTREVQPRDRFERAVIKALGEISWDEAIIAIRGHRSGDCNCWDCRAVQ